MSSPAGLPMAPPARSVPARRGACALLVLAAAVAFYSLDRRWLQISYGLPTPDHRAHEIVLNTNGAQTRIAAPLMLGGLFLLIVGIGQLTSRSQRVLSVGGTAAVAWVLATVGFLVGYDDIGSGDGVGFGFVAGLLGLVGLLVGTPRGTRGRTVAGAVAVVIVITAIAFAVGQAHPYPRKSY